MKIMKAVLAVLVVVLVILLVFFSYQYGRTRLAAKQAELATQQKQAEIVELKKTEVAATAKAAEAARQAAALQQQVTALQNSMNQATAELKHRLTAIQTAQPYELVADARRVLGVGEKDIFWNGTQVIFTLEAFRQQVKVNADWESFTLYREPNYQAKVNLLEAKDLKRIEELAAKDEVINSLTKQVADHMAIESSLRTQLVASKRASLFKEVGYSVVSGASGYLLGSLIGHR
jgi:uncharacterized secreted protein with C-terminal beta-propeller domain